MNFTLSLDRQAKIITFIVTVLFLAFIVFQVPIITGNNQPPVIFSVTALILTYVICYLFKPLHYSINENGIIIHRLWKNVIVPTEDISEIRRVEKSEINPAFRTGVSGGMFGYFGNFYKFGVGKMKWYTSRRDNAIMIKTKEGKKIIITPDEPEAFINTYDKMK